MIGINIVEIYKYKCPDYNDGERDMKLFTS